MRYFGTLFLISILTLACAGNQQRGTESVTMRTVRQFGAKGDGITDDTAAFQQALDAAYQSGGGVVHVPAASYRIESHLVIPNGVTLQGEWTTPHHSQMPIEASGSLLLAFEGKDDEMGPPFIFLKENSAARGLTIFYPEQSIENVSPYPWTFRGTGMHCSIENVTLVNAYNGIDFSHQHELHYIRNVFGVCLRRGILIDHCTDIGRIENVHFNPHYWQRTPWANAPQGELWQKLLDYLTTNGEAFIFARSDWEYVFNTFCFGYKIGYRFISRDVGPMNGNFLGIGADGGNVAIQVDAAFPYGILITNGQFVSMFGEKPMQIVTNPGFDGVLQLNNCSFWGPAFSCATLRGPGTVSFNQCNFVHWNEKSYAISAEAGHVTVTNCRFHQSENHIQLKEPLKSAIVMGNTFGGKMDIENNSKASVEIGLNVDAPK